MTDRKKILVVEDDHFMNESLCIFLGNAGYDTLGVFDGRSALREFENYKPDLIMLDVMIPEPNGIEVCETIRETSGVPIFMLTALTEKEDELRGLYAGADDYITKPIKPRALMSRIAALFRRDSKKDQEKGQIKIRDLNVDRSSYTIDKAGKTITLPKKEFELLYFLANNPNVVYSRDELLHNIWGSDVFVLARTVDVHIRKVREKIGEEYITTVKGVGYKFELG